MTDEIDHSDPLAIHWIDFNLLVKMAGFESPYFLRLRGFPKIAEYEMHGLQEIGTTMVKRGGINRFETKKYTKDERVVECFVTSFSLWRDAVIWMKDNLYSAVSMY